MIMETHTLAVSREQVNILHDLILRAIDTGSGLLPECTSTPDCVACNLYDKIYLLWKETNGDLP